MELKQIQSLKKINQKGYVLINVNENWVFEHKYKVEEFIGRKLKKEEVVHHDDSNKENNRIMNLILFPNQKSHAHFHRQISQFGFTRPRILELNKLKKKMFQESILNLENE